MRFLETPATVWGAESVLIDEISRCKPEHQNRLFSLVHERRMQGIAAAAAALPLGGDEPVHVRPGRHRGLLGLRAARPRAGRSLRADRRRGDWGELTSRAAAASPTPSGEGASRRRTTALRCDRSRLARTVRRAGERVPACRSIDYVTTVVTALNGGGIRISPRRARLLARSLLAATIVAGRARRATFRSVLDCSLPHPTWGERPSRADDRRRAPRGAGTASRETAERWVHAFLAEQQLRASSSCCSSAARPGRRARRPIAQLLANEPKERAAAFAFAIYPAALAGQAADRRRGRERPGEVAAPCSTSTARSAGRSASASRTPATRIAEIGKVLAPLQGARPSGRGSSSRPAWCAGSRCRRRPSSSSNSTAA